MPGRILIIVLLGFGSLCAVADTTVIPLASPAQSSVVERLANPGFEEGGAGWYGWMLGFEVVDGGGRNNSRGVRCVAANTEEQHGAGQLVTLNQAKPAPIVVSGWSRAETVDGASDNGYSVYVDVNFTDGDHLWGQTACFSVGTHDWEERSLLLVPEKPVASLTAFGLFRGHNGTVWFDDLSVVEADGGCNVFEGVLTGKSAPFPDPADTCAVFTNDGLKISLDRNGGALSALALNDAVLGENGWPVFVRDAARSSDFIAPNWTVGQKGETVSLSGEAATLQIHLSMSLTARGDTIEMNGAVRDLSGKDRAVTVYVPLPVSGEWTWSDDMRQNRPAKGLCANTFRTGAGATGTRSSYPLAVLTGTKGGLVLAVPIDEPRHHRLAYDADRGMFYAAFDFGLSPATKNFPGGASFRALLYACDPVPGFRGALDRYYRLFPAAFEKRVDREGLWMAFTDISTLPNPEDFGFAYQEGAPNAVWDEQHGILSFPYTEPMTTWFKLAPEISRTRGGAVGYLRALQDNKDDPLHGSACSAAVSAVLDGGGDSILSVVNAPWCDGCVFALNADPAIPVDTQGVLNRGQAELKRLESMVAGGSPEKTGLLDGVYIDSYEFWANSINHNTAHFKNADIPLVFDAQSRRVGLLTVFTTFAFNRELAARMHALGKYVMANGVLAGYDVPAAHLDILGTETNWMPGGKWQPMTGTELCFRRALSGQKPYCFLMNTHYDDFTLELTERYFQRALAYGMFPGFFSENASTNCYFANPKWYEPARPLFKKYIPLIQTIAKAGWQPVTRAKSSDPAVCVERFGDPGENPLYFTVFNDSGESRSLRVEMDLASLGRADKEVAVFEMISGEVPALDGRGVVLLALAPEQACLLRVSF